MDANDDKISYTYANDAKIIKTDAKRAKKKTDANDAKISYTDGNASVLLCLASLASV